MMIPKFTDVGSQTCGVSRTEVLRGMRQDQEHMTGIRNSMVKQVWKILSSNEK